MENRIIQIGALSPVEGLPAVKISKRVQELEESATLAVASKAAAMKTEGLDVVSLGAGEPDFDTPEHIVAAAEHALRAGETKYAKPASGIPALKQAIIGKLKRENGLVYQPNEVLATVGGKEALWLAFATLLDPGDEVIIPAPYWVSYPEQVHVAEGVPVIIEASAEAGFRITPAQLEAALTPRTRAFVFNSPSNPTGAAYKPDEIDALAAVLDDRNDVTVISDEIYDRLLYGGRTHKSYAAVSDHTFQHTITFNAGSKTYSMTGWRIGYAAGPAEVIGGMGKLQSQTSSGAATFTMHALAAALDGNQQCVEEMRVEFECRADYLYRRLNELPGVSCPAAAGAFYAFPDVSGVYSHVGVDGSTAFATKLLEDAYVAVVPGEAFGADACVRLSFATSMENIKKGLDRIEEFLG